MNGTIAERERPARYSVHGSQQVTVLDLLDRLLGGGVVIRGQIMLAAADIDLVELDLGILVAAIDKAARR